MTSSKSKRMARGFTLLELMLVVAIILVVAAMATPNIMTGINNVRLRSSASGVSSLLQTARMTAVKDNRYYSMNQQTITSGSSPYNIVYADLNGNGQWDANEPLVQLPANVRFDASGANPTFSSSTVNSYTTQLGSGFTPQAPNVPPSFNARGLPCLVAGAVCRLTTPAGGTVSFLYFMRLDGALGTRWAAVSITPAGRVKTWMWDGRTWN